jgi:hypothetical protein
MGSFGGSGQTVVLIDLDHFSDLPNSELSLLSGVKRKLDVETPKRASGEFC